MRRSPGIWLVTAIVWAACSTTKFASTWKDPSVQRLDIAGKRVVGFVLARDQVFRRSAEDALARALRGRGVDATPGYQLVPDEDRRDRDSIRRRLRDLGVDGAVVMRVIDRRQEVTYDPPSGPYYGSFYGYWDYGWAAVGNPGYMRSDTIVSVETLVYSVPDDKLLWGGVSETIDPRKLDALIKDIVDQAAKEMRKAGLMEAGQ